MTLNFALTKKPYGSESSVGWWRAASQSLPTIESANLPCRQEEQQFTAELGTCALHINSFFGCAGALFSDSVVQVAIFWVLSQLCNSVMPGCTLRCCYSHRVLLLSPRWSMAANRHSCPRRLNNNLASLGLFFHCAGRRLIRWARADCLAAQARELVLKTF